MPSEGVACKLIVSNAWGVVDKGNRTADIVASENTMKREI